LKKHLLARNEPILGNKKQLIEKLLISLEDERLQGIAYAEELERKHRMVADLEESGAVYVVGSNQDGQLGLEDLDHRKSFTVIPSTRGLKINHVACGNNITFAVTEDNIVYTWGGAGVGPSGLKVEENDIPFHKPHKLENLDGEEIVKTTVGSKHVCALSEGGDCFIWGNGKFGELGLGSTTSHLEPILMNSFRKQDIIKDVVAGDKHTCALTVKGEVYSWGHGASGRLGIGITERIGVPNSEKFFFPAPALVKKLPSSQYMKQISCGTEHVIARGTSRVFSWGSGDGGRLGHGDHSNRFSPEAIVLLDSWNVFEISAGTWHSACIVQIPPLKDSGWVYTWVSGLVICIIESIFLCYSYML